MGSLNHREVASFEMSESCAALPRGADSSPGGLDRSPVDRRPAAEGAHFAVGLRLPCVGQITLGDSRCLLRHPCWAVYVQPWSSWPRRSV